MQEYKYVYEVYKERSFSRAARNLYISQPALSATIRKIEDKLGLQLFDRSTTALALTEAGEAYIQTARRIMELEEDLHLYLDDLANLNKGSLVLAGTAFFSSYIIPPIVREYQKKYPGISLEFTESDSLELYQMAQESRIDLIVDAGAFDSERFARRALFEETILLAVPGPIAREEGLEGLALSARDIAAGRHLLAETEGICLKAFQDRPFLLLKKEHDLYRRAMAICREQEVTPASFIHLNQLMTAFNLACQGLGIAFVSDSLVKCSRIQADVCYYKISVQDQQLIRREVFVAYRKNCHVTRAMKSFLELAEEIYRETAEA